VKRGGIKVMMIIQIALGIVLAVLVLRFWPLLISGSIVGILLAVSIAALVFLGIAISKNIVGIIVISIMVFFVFFFVVLFERSLKLFPGFKSFYDKHSNFRIMVMVVAAVVAGVLSIIGLGAGIFLLNGK
jgi:hypothetical protein